MFFRQNGSQLKLLTESLVSANNESPWNANRRALTADVDFSDEEMSSKFSKS